MPNRLKIAVLAAVFFGLIAAYGVYNFLRQQKESREALEKATQEIIVASKDIPPGTAIDKEMVKLAPWPKASIPVGSFSAPEQVVGKVNKVKAVAGEPVLQSKLAGEGAGLTVLLTPGSRAMAVKVDEIIGVSGFIAPNDRVDVIATLIPPGKNGQDEKFSKIVLQNKRVLSVAQSVEQKDGKAQVARSITLEVTPEESEKLSLAQLQGELILALRALGDENTIQTRGSTKRDLLTIAAVPVRSGGGKMAPAPVVPKKFIVEIYSGSEKTVKEF
jgi:pilus assembly protein CpaB